MIRILARETGAGFGGALTSLQTLLARLDPSLYEVVLASGYDQNHIVPAGAVRETLTIKRNRRYGPGSRLQAALAPYLGKRAGNAAFLVDLATTGRACARTLADLARKNRTQLVHANNGLLINDCALRAACRAGLPCVVHCRSLEYPGMVGRLLARKASRFLAVSRCVARSLTRLGVEPERIDMAPEGLDAEAFRASADAEGVRRALGLPEGKPVVCLVACLVPWKGHEVFLRACAQALPDADAVAVVAGASPDGDPAPLRRLRDLARDLGLEKRVVFAGHQRDVAGVMVASDVVAHASTAAEPFGRVILEAMAVGRPVVATDAGGPAEIVESERTGLLVRPGDAQDMAQAISRLLADPGLGSALAQNASLVVERYSLERHVLAVTEAWSKALA